MDNRHCHAYTSDYDTTWSSPSEITFNFLVAIGYAPYMIHRTFEEEFSTIISNLDECGYIHYHSYRHIGGTVSAYFMITPLGRDYLTFSKL